MRRAMPEANVLYAVTGAVVLGLVLWVATVLKTSKEAWARPRSEILEPEPEATGGTETEAAAPKADPKAEPEPEPEAAATKTDSDEKDEPAPGSDKEKQKDVTDVLADVRNEEAKMVGIDADSTAKATPVAKKSESKTEAAKAVAAAEEESDETTSSADEKKA